MADPTSFTPWGAIAQGVGGIAQTIFGAIGAGKAQRGLEKMIKGYKPNAGIMDYYTKALNKYSANPYTSSLYNAQTKAINRNLNFGISQFQNRRAGVGGIGSLVQGANDASLKAAGAAEQQQGQALSQLRQATQIKAAEDFKPFEMKYNLLAAKAGGANKVLGAGLQNVFGGIASWQDQSLANQLYGTGRTRAAGGMSSYLPTTRGSRLLDNGMPMGNQTWNG